MEAKWQEVGDHAPIRLIVVGEHIAHTYCGDHGNLLRHLL